MAAHIAMHTESQVMLLAQWFSPAYPIGAFAYSHGLEQAVEAGAVTDEFSLGHWIEDVLEYGAGQSDAFFLAAAYRSKGGSALEDLDNTCRAFCPSKERLLETELQGAAFCEVTAAVWKAEICGLTYPVAAGRAAALENLPLSLTLRLYLQAFASNMVGAAMRLAPIGQTAGQRLVHAMTPLVETVAVRALDGDLKRLSGTAFVADIASMKHETQYSRIFRT